MINTIAGVTSAVIALITLITGSALYWHEKCKSKRKVLAQLKQEIACNLKALEFSNYEAITPLNLDQPVFQKLVKSLNNKTAAACYFNDFKPPRRKERETARETLRFIMDKIIDLKQLSPFNKEEGPNVNLKKRLNNLKERLETLENILEENPAELMQSSTASEN